MSQSSGPPADDVSRSPLTSMRLNWPRLGAFWYPNEIASDMRMDCEDGSNGLPSVMLKSSPVVACAPKVRTNVPAVETAGSSKTTMSTFPSCPVGASRTLKSMRPAGSPSTIGLMKAVMFSNPFSVRFEPEAFRAFAS